MDSEKKIIGRCPLCGGNVVKTCKGYRCENSTGEHPSCVLNINAIIGNRKMNDGEIAEFLEKRRILLDGFSTKEGKTFPTVLEAKELCEKNITSSELEMYREDGSIYRKRLGLAPDKLQIVKI